MTMLDTVTTSVTGFEGGYIMKKLKCCPFCGHEGTLRSMRFGMEKADRYAVTCTVCQIAIGWEDTEEEAVERWNRRVEDVD